MNRFAPLGLAGGLCLFLVVGFVSVHASAGEHDAKPFWPWGSHHTCSEPACVADDGDLGGTWYWLRSPDEERRVVAALYNRYCIRCHGVDGRGVWDIPGVPDFTNARWQASRSDGQLARIIVEGRGAVMPAFRGTLNLEEAWAMARYLRTFLPGTELSRPDYGPPEKPAGGPQVPATTIPPATPQ